MFRVAIKISRVRNSKMNITALEISQVRYLIIHKKIRTISYVQRRLNISYNKAQIIVESIKKKN